MVDRRRFPLADGCVLIAKDRSSRPHEFRPESAGRVAMRCPFCAGHEADTPNFVAVYPARAIKGRAGQGRAEQGREQQGRAGRASTLRPGGVDLAASGTTGISAGDGAVVDITGWQVRVVPNKYPAVDAYFPSSTAVVNKPVRRSRKSTDETSRELFPCEAACGVHEVVIEAPDHRPNFSDITQQQARYTLLAYRDRMLDHASRTGLQYSLVFRNGGAAGGASLAHVHSQIIATPWIPTTVQIELRYARQAFAATGKCLICSLLREELRRRVRIVATTRKFVAFCPYASRFCYETWIVPRQHRSRFERTPDRDLAELADLMRQVMHRIERLPELRGYNFWLHSTPFSVADDAQYHWHLEIAPRVTNVAGFEWGGGDYINPVPPEEAAAILRQ